MCDLDFYLQEYKELDSRPLCIVLVPEAELKMGEQLKIGKYHLMVFSHFVKIYYFPIARLDNYFLGNIQVEWTIFFRPDCPEVAVRDMICHILVVLLGNSFLGNTLAAVEWTIFLHLDCPEATVLKDGEYHRNEV